MDRLLRSDAGAARTRGAYQPAFAGGAEELCFPAAAGKYGTAPADHIVPEPLFRFTAGRAAAVL